MDIRYIDYILAISEYGTISKAAKSLYLAQPTLSQYLANQENELGMLLFERTKHGLVPTKAGLLYIQTARQIQALRNKFDTELSKLKSDVSDCIRIGFMTVAGSAMFSNVFPLFKAALPDVNLDVIESKTSELLAELRGNELDIAIIASTAPSLPDMKNVILKKEPFFLAISKKHTVFSKWATPPQTLSKDDFQHLRINHIILSPENTVKRQVESSIMKQCGLNPDRVTEIRNINTTLNMVSSSNAIAFVPSGFIHTNDKNLYFPLDFSPHWYLNVVYMHMHVLSAHEQYLVSLIQDYYQENEYYG